MSATSAPRLPRDHEAERRLLSCCLDWPERAGELLPLVEPRDMVDKLHQRIWARLRTQHWQAGAIDMHAAGRDLDCCDYLLELAGGSPTTATAYVYAERVRLAARGRRLYELCERARQAVLRGRPADAIAPQLQLALEALGAEVTV